MFTYCFLTLPQLMIAARWDVKLVDYVPYEVSLEMAKLNDLGHVLPDISFSASWDEFKQTASPNTTDFDLIILRHGFKFTPWSLPDQKYLVVVEGKSSSSENCKSKTGTADFLKKQGRQAQTHISNKTTRYMQAKNWKKLEKARV